MNGVARIVCRDGALVLPARNQYDREVVFEEAEYRARRHGEAKLEINRREMRLKVSEERQSDLCATCGHGMGMVAFAVGDLSLCRHCARRSLH